MAKNRSKREPGTGSIFKRKDGRYVAQVLLYYDERGKPKYKIGYSRSEKEIVTVLNKIIAEVTSGKTIPTKRQTVAQFLDHWMETSVIGQKEPKTVRYYTFMIDKHIKPTLGKIDVRQLNAAQIQALLSEKSKPRKVGEKTVTLSPSTVSSIRRVLCAALNQAWKWDMVAQNVVPKTTAPRIVKRDPVYLTPEQAQALLEKADGHAIRNLLAFALGTGVRVGEATGLRWQDVDFETNTVYVNVQLQRIDSKLTHKSTKSSSSRRSLPILGSVLESLKAEQERQLFLKASIGKDDFNPLDLVFLNAEGRALDPKYVDNHLKALCAKAEIPIVSFHKLRHTAATLMVAAGVPLALVKDQLGHSSITLTTGTYAHMVPAAQREAAEKLDRALRIQSEIANVNQ